MGLHIELGEDHHLRFSVSGDFNCEVSRAILQRVRTHWRTRSTPVHADLGGVTQASPCAATLLVLLVEMLVGNFLLERCSADLEALYVEALMREAPPISDFEKGCSCPKSADQPVR
jgi:hypothetical protein